MSNTKTAKLFKLLFWLTTIIHLISILTGPEIISIISKPFLMIFLGGYFWSVAGKLQPVKSSLPVYAALLFSFFGDILLMFIDYEDIWFITGLFSFMMAQIFYILTYKVYQLNTGLKPRVYTKILLSLIITVYVMILWVKLYLHLEDMLIPVTIYTLTILAMVLMAITRLRKTSSRSFILVFSGAVIFLLSDSMIAINKFMLALDHQRILIMSTYILGQYLIISGLIEHVQYKYKV